MAVFIYGVSSERMLLFLPLFVPLAAAGNVQEELKSRYAVFLVSRAGKKNYLAGKILGAALSGGLMTVTAFAAALPDAVGPDAHPGADLRSGDSDLRTLYLDLRGYRIRAFIHAAPAGAFC